MFFERTSLGMLARLGNPDHPEYQQAWERFVKDYETPIYNWCRQFFGERQVRGVDAEDIASEVVRKVFQAMPEFTYDERGSFHSWLKTIVINTCRNVAGRKAVTEEVLQEMDQSGELDQMVETLESMISDKDRKIQAACEDVRNRVKESTWRAFEMTVLGGQSHADVADKLGMTTTQVGVYRYRVTGMLRALLLDE